MSKLDTSRLDAISKVATQPAPLTPAPLTPAEPTPEPERPKRIYTRIQLNTRRNNAIRGRKVIRQNYNLTLDLVDELNAVIRDIEAQTGKRVNKSEIIRIALAKELRALRKGLNGGE